MECYLASETARGHLFDFIRQVWREEEVPESLVLGVFVPIFKKGQADDMKNYRFICLLNHAYKVLSLYLLSQLRRQDSRNTKMPAEKRQEKEAKEHTSTEHMPSARERS